MADTRGATPYHSRGLLFLESLDGKKGGRTAIIKEVLYMKWYKRLISKLDMYLIKKFLGTYFFSIALIISIAGGIRLQ